MDEHGSFVEAGLIAHGVEEDWASSFGRFSLCPGAAELKGSGEVSGGAATWNKLMTACCFDFVDLGMVVMVAMGKGLVIL
ncbi:hypothetical protein M0R45_021417 [Rubus argutus]|uniref:Uncharacterized protein n=1 Tax=Rubus argutus TaxID=59490 RepID=A0AAW1XCL7_RUBAR